MENMLPKQMSYEALEKQWGGMLRRFIWNIPGMDREDVLQELRIVLMLAQQRYDPDRGCAFSTYLWRACVNKVGKLLYKTKEVKKRIPAWMIISLCEGDHSTSESTYCPSCLELPWYLDDVEVLDLMTGESQEVQMLAGLILRGESTRKSWEQRGLSSSQIKQGVTGLKDLLKGGRDARGK